MADANEVVRCIPFRSAAIYCRFSIFWIAARLVPLSYVSSSNPTCPPYTLRERHKQNRALPGAQQFFSLE